MYLECIGWVKVSESERFIGITSFKNPRVKFDGKHWYLTVAVEVSPEVTLLTDEVIGVDLGVKELRKLEKQKKRLQRQSARKYKAQRQSGTAVIKGEHLMKSNNQKKLEERISSLCRRQANIRNTYMCQVVSDLVKTHPLAIVMENLNVTGMLKNGKLSRSIQEQAFGAILNQTEWKCMQVGIELLQADRFYLSSKRCNACGYVHKELKLSDRIYICPCCGHRKDRDANAADNLRDYGKLLLTTA